MAELGTVERAYADGYAAAQAEIERLGNLCDTYAEFIAERGLWADYSAWCGSIVRNPVRFRGADVNEAEIRAVVNEQAEDDGLWFVPETITEDYLQRALRRLHAVIEGKSPEQCAIEALAK